MRREESPGDQAQSDDIAQRANNEQRAPAQPINQSHADEGEDEIDHTDSNGLKQGGFLRQAGHLEKMRPFKRSGGWPASWAFVMSFIDRPMVYISVLDFIGAEGWHGLFPLFWHEAVVRGEPGGYK